MKPDTPVQGMDVRTKERLMVGDTLPFSWDRVFVTAGAGFLDSHLSERPLTRTPGLGAPPAGAALALAAALGRPGTRRALKETAVRLPAAVARRRTLPPHVERAVRLLDGRTAGGGAG
ncbi:MULTISPECIES: hypothetical protein [unclassified Streptomyces]|uniref:hypothetical protein n=1 Tax=unclassified Streptomyces TaxID=2593676 RepID=UPI003658F887